MSYMSGFTPFSEISSTIIFVEIMSTHKMNFIYIALEQGTVSFAYSLVK